MNKISKSKLSFTILKIILIISACTLTEIFVFNFRFFLPKLFNAPEMTIKPINFSELNSSIIDDETGNLQVTGDSSSFKIENVLIPVYSVKINVTRSFNKNESTNYFGAKLSYTDENFEYSSQESETVTIRSSIPASEYIHIITSGKCETLDISLDHLTNNVISINSVDINKEYFNFSVVRFATITFICLLIFLIVHLRLWEKKAFVGRWQSVLLVLVFLVAASTATAIYLANNKVEYVMTEKMADNTDDSYQQLTKAFYNNQLYFTITPNENLTSLENPYDKSLRPLDTLWDSIYFKGKYYSYFGVAPVITLLLPVKLISGYYLTTDFACLIFVLIALTAAFTLYLNIIQLWFKKINFLAYLSGAAAVSFSLIFWLIARPLFYELAEASAIAFLLMALNMLISLASGGKKITFKLLLCGLFFGLMVASRPTFIFFIAIAVPFLLKSIISDKIKLRKKLLRTIAFFTPLGIIAVSLGVYNYVRFGSPFDFGINYQLTVSNLRFNKVTNFVQAFNGFYHYFFQPLDLDLRFPFFHVVSKAPSAINEFYFKLPIAGVFNFPLLGIIFATFYIIKRRMQEDKLKKWFIIISLAVCLLITYLDITLAGSIMRYTLDIYPLMLFCAVILWLEICEYFAERGAGAPVTKLFAVVTALTVIITMAVCLIGEQNFFSINRPELYQYVTSLFEFWR